VSNRFFQNFLTQPPTNPEVFSGSRQLLKKPPKPVKYLFQKKQTLDQPEILKSPEEPLSISWSAASNEANQVSQAAISKKLRNDYLPNPAPRR
jgi:hypothetical protein